MTQHRKLGGAANTCLVIDGSDKGVQGEAFEEGVDASATTHSEANSSQADVMGVVVATLLSRIVDQAYTDQNGVQHVVKVVAAELVAGGRIASSHSMSACF